MLGWAAVLVSQYGLGNGFAVLFVALSMERLWRTGLSMASQAPGAWSDASLVVLLALLVALPLMATRRSRRAPSDPGPRIPIPTCSLSVIPLSLSLLDFPSTLAGWFKGLKPLATALRPGSLFAWERPAIALAIAIWFAWLFCPPSAVVRAFQQAAPEKFDDHDASAVQRALARANLRSIALVAAILFFPSIMATLGAPEVFTPTTLYSLALLVAVVLDLRAELSARRQAGPFDVAASPQRVYAVDPILRALATAGITGFARTLHYRALFQFFAPYAPVEILVPQERKDEAEAICARILS